MVSALTASTLMVRCFWCLEMPSWMKQGEKVSNSPGEFLQLIRWRKKKKRFNNVQPTVHVSVHVKENVHLRNLRFSPRLQQRGCVCSWLTSSVTDTEASVTSFSISNSWETMHERKKCQCDFFFFYRSGLCWDRILSANIFNIADFVGPKWWPNSLPFNKES